MEDSIIALLRWPNYSPILMSCIILFANPWHIIHLIDQNKVTSNISNRFQDLSFESKCSHEDGSNLFINVKSDGLLLRIQIEQSMEIKIMLWSFWSTIIDERSQIQFRNTLWLFLYFPFLFSLFPNSRLEIRLYSLLP